MLWCWMEATDQQYLYKIVFSIDWILSWLESRTILDSVGYRKVPQFPTQELLWSTPVNYDPTNVPYRCSFTYQ